MIISEGVDEMRRIVARTTLDLCRGGLQEAVEVKRLKVVLAEDKIAYHGNVGDASCPLASHVHLRARMILVILTPIWILQTFP